MTEKMTVHATKPAPPPVAAPRVLPEGEFAVKEIRFCRPAGVDCPVPGANGGINILRTGKDYEITFVARLRHHRVVCKDVNAPEAVFYVHESWCLWIPTPPAPEKTS